MRRAILAAAVAMGCAPKLKTVEDEPITAAWLEYFDLSSIAMLGGVVDGDAFLGYTTASGEQRSMPVHLGGPVVGLAFDMTVDPEWGPSLPLDFTEAEVDPVMLSDALGTFHGSTASFVMTTCSGKYQARASGAIASAAMATATPTRLCACAPYPASRRGIAPT